MPPARSTKTSRASAASSSQTTLDSIPPIEVAESITPGYVISSHERHPLDEEERAKLVHELVGFNPNKLCSDIAEVARNEIYTTVAGIEEWLRPRIKTKNDENEVNIGLHALETLLESHVDKAFDKFTAWVLRNAFEFSPELEVVLPWHKGLDFARGEYVASQPRGQDGLDLNIDELRTKVEQARLLSQKLELAEKKLERRIEIAKQRKAEVGFVKDVIDSAGLSPLHTPSAQILSTLTSLHTALSPLDTIPTSFAPPSTIVSGAGTGSSGSHTKAWELGRAAYLNWALGKMVPTSGNNPSEGGGETEGRLEKIEKAIEEVGSVEGVESVARSLTN
ncbi:hypothetical protein CI109_103952 [Kwoniella shandongensis]|uniref:Uncharacterized protein n=1 Tax=Kwoniella shandongensis TaxID=1734106 RepID=A0A5M6BT01_9TREE|nr:uncharacterized protein CI109_005593 [Kwoniella shandongensis]KAA5525998.1 hypothetical protein CI109_005593 [Kwoniella shandongensis]